MPRSCEYHRDRDAVEELGDRAYCAECRRAQRAAALLVDRHVEPADCFVSYFGNGRWVPTPGEPAAHWVAHQLGVQTPPGRDGCLLGFAVRLEEVLLTRRELTPEMRVRPGDLWVSLDESHCGLVSSVRRDPEQGIRIAIRHVSPKQRRLATDDFYQYFLGSGKFYR